MSTPSVQTSTPNGCKRRPARLAPRRRRPLARCSHTPRRTHACMHACAHVKTQRAPHVRVFMASSPACLPSTCLLPHVPARWSCHAREQAAQHRRDHVLRRGLDEAAVAPRRRVARTCAREREAQPQEPNVAEGAGYLEVILPTRAAAYPTALAHRVKSARSRQPRDQ